MVYYHGSDALVERISPHRMSCDGELLCSTASINVARRYGSVVTKLRLADVAIAKMSVTEWFGGDITPFKLRAEGFAAVIIVGNPASFDFPVDSLFVLRSDAVDILGEVPKAEMEDLDDGLPSHEPNGPADNGWSHFVADFYRGNQTAALADVGWNRCPNGTFKKSMSLPDEGKTWECMVIPDGRDQVKVVDNGVMRGVFASLSSALSAADGLRKCIDARNIYA